MWSKGGRPCRTRVLAGGGACGRGRAPTHTGLGWMGGLVLRMEVAFSVAEPGSAAGHTKSVTTQT